MDTPSAGSGAVDLRCANVDCELFELKLEADEVVSTPGPQADRCAACGYFLEVYRGHPHF
jgi:hypothetical protein